MQAVTLKIGELARRTGLTVRTLHWYDELGLLRPSLRSPAGYRLYTAEDVVRLHQIRALRQLGLPLEEIKEALERRTLSPERVVRLHLARLKEQMEHERRLCARLEAIERMYRAAEEVSVDAFLEAIEEMTMMEKYFTPEQLDELAERGRRLGADRIRQVEEEWKDLIAEVRAAMDRGDDPASPPVRELARRWKGLVEEFTGGSREIAASVGRLYREQPEAAARHGYPIDQAMFDYIGRAGGGGPGS
jgi:DNA-binding transcriptional MerR regulator